MVQYWITADEGLVQVESACKDCWINMVAPTESEINGLSEEVGVLPEFLRTPLDEEERSHIDVEDDQTLVVVDVPVTRMEHGTSEYSTIPLGVILLPACIVTVCLLETSVIKSTMERAGRSVRTGYRAQLLLLLLFRMANHYLHYLKQIDKTSNNIEKQLHKSQKNKELIQMLNLEKSLVYFSTSLKSNEATIEKISRGRSIKLYEEDKDILEDVLIEIRQAIEMSNIYSSILSGTMDAFASVISNNLNIVMKVLTSLTILMTVPNIIFGMYGMNVDDLPWPHFWVPLAITAVVTGAVGILLAVKKMF